MHTPAWVRDAVFYQIFPDRFASSNRVDKPSNLEAWDAPPTLHGYKGGDLVGVAEKLDYLCELGVSALYFNPVFQSSSNHRYHTHDYRRVDPMLGGDKALAVLLQAAHERGVKVVLDGVFNHASRGFFQFNDILENGPKSAYLDWFHVHRFPLNAYGGEGELGYAAWWGLPALPKFNTATPAVREFLLEVATYWLERGIDGWRLDVPNEIDDDDFWREFRSRCRRIDPECYLVGEIWGDADRWLKGDQFDAVMNYPFTRAVLGFVASRLNTAEIKRSGYQHIKRLDAAGLAAELGRLLKRHRPEVTAVQLNLLGSHDTPRALTVLMEDEDAFKMALVVLLTFPGAPCLYYGDEIGLTGGHDPNCRGAMPWQNVASWNRGLLAHTKALTELRRQHVALRTGSFVTVYAERDLFLYLRRSESECFLVALNRGTRQARVDLRVEAAMPEGVYRDALGGLSLELNAGRLRGYDLPPRSGKVFRKL